MFQNILNRIRKIRQQKAVILMYHQVCERRHDPWELAVQPNHFYEQLEYLRKNFRVVSLSDLAEGIAHNKIRHKTVAITFDDGFKDNYTTAAPLLDWHELPATFYVATTPIVEGKAYWWDVLQDVLFATQVLPSHYEGVINGEMVRFTFRKDRILNNRLTNQIRAWNYNLPVPNERISFYMHIWQRLKPLPFAEQNKILNEIKDWAECGENIVHSDVTMSVREMRMLSENPLFSIGAHSVNHAMLSQHDAGSQAFEIKESKRQLEQWLSKPVKSFAYPYGNYNEVTQSLLKEAGFQHAVSTESKPLTAEDDPFALPRVQVKNWCVYEFASKLNELVNE
jgi:peptidoglycan/xylan/chitin deacetylase (PgdA/CDA1 family)